jgi:hypothetical protein
MNGINMKKQLLGSFLLFLGLTAMASDNDNFKGMRDLYSNSKNPSAKYFDTPKTAQCTEIYENGDHKISTIEFVKKDAVVTGHDDLSGNEFQFSINVWRTSWVAKGLHNDSKFNLHMRETPDGGLVLRISGAWDHSMGYISCSII